VKELSKRTSEGRTEAKRHKKTSWKAKDFHPVNQQKTALKEELPKKDGTQKRGRGEGRSTMRHANEKKNYLKLMSSKSDGHSTLTFNGFLGKKLVTEEGKHLGKEKKKMKGCREEGGQNSDLQSATRGQRLEEATSEPREKKQCKRHTKVKGKG